VFRILLVTPLHAIHVPSSTAATFNGNRKLRDSRFLNDVTVRVWPATTDAPFQSPAARAPIFELARRLIKKDRRKDSRTRRSQRWMDDINHSKSRTQTRSRQTVVCQSFSPCRSQCDSDRTIRDSHLNWSNSETIIPIFRSQFQELFNRSINSRSIRSSRHSQSWLRW
jgi:hypothetical protein